MSQTIQFKKNCTMQTYVAEIADISVSHDYKVLDDTIEGYFDVSGLYKVTKSSIQTEEFMFSVPFTIALSSLIDRDSINLTIKDFNYSIEKDILSLVIDLNMDYDEIKLEKEEESLENVLDSAVNEELEKIKLEEETSGIVENNQIVKIEKEEKESENMGETKDEFQKDVTEKEINSILGSFEETNDYYKYKIYIMRSEDTIESVAIKYNVSLNDLASYNNVSNINVGDKIIIPYIKSEE